MLDARRTKSDGTETFSIYAIAARKVNGGAQLADKTHIV